MDKFIRSDDIVLLLDNYSSDSQRLRTSFQKAGYRIPTVVIEEDGYLPEDVLSVFGFFLGNYKEAKNIPGRPRYFNEIPVPDYWEISGTNSFGKIQDLDRERGRIFYAEPLHRRLVKVVDWYDERGKARSSDHYNRYGALYARTAFNVKGQRVNKSWFSADGREIIVENYVTGDIILNEGEQVRIFRGRAEFTLYVLGKVGFERNRIFYNSLSTPFFVSQSLHSVYKRDVLFWQEPVREDIPGNMQIILNGEASRTARIMVQKRHSCEQLLRLGASPQVVQRLGFIYPFKKENRHRRQALICTNSDQIERFEEMVKALPEMHFHVAALTEMSPKLMRMEAYGNVSLYPGVRADVLEELFDACDFYLDINHGGEIASAVYRAFLNNHLILGFREILHNGDYVAEEHCYGQNDFQRMISDIRSVMADGKELERWLKRQHRAALSETREGYLQFYEKKRKPVSENPPITVHITNLQGKGAQKAQTAAQHNVAQIGRELGFREIPLFSQALAGKTKSEVRRQVAGIASVIKDNDIVIFQSPAWNVDACDRELLREIRRHRNIRLAIFIHDVMPMMLGGTENDYQQVIKSYNLADLVIVPTEAMLGFLRKRGLNVKKVLIQPMWDLPFSGDLRRPEFQRRILFSEIAPLSPEQRAFLSSWNYEVPLRVFVDEDFESGGKNIALEGHKNTTELLTEFTKGGFGLVWQRTSQPDYDKCSQPHELARYLAAGIPVIVKEGLAHDQTVREYEAGFVVGSLEEAAEKVKNVTEEEYRRMADNVGNISTLVRGGFFTKKMLLDAVNYLMLG